MQLDALARLHFGGISADDIVWGGQAPLLRPQLELSETQEAYRLHACFTHLDAKDLELRVGPDFLEIEGHQVAQAPRFWRLCFAGLPARELRFARRFPLVRANPLRAEAKFDGRSLVVTIPKAVLLAPSPESIRRLVIEVPAKLAA